MLATGTKIGPYQISGPLGAGGMGEVYRASDTRLGREVAIKVLPASFAADADRLRRFEQEARTTGMLNHPNILAVYDVGTHEGSPYLVTELLEGRTLKEELPVLRRKALDYARQVAVGLAAAHAKGVTHRDLKPDNLFITKDGRVKILDFGLAKVAAPEDSELTQTGATTPGVAMGTVGYMSPEQARGAPADHRSDIFSFGVVFYEMLSGQRAFQRDSAIETLSAILKEDPPPLSDATLEPVVRRCLEKSPEQRFQSASDLGFAIEAMSGSVMTTAVLPPPDKPKSAGRTWMIAAVCAIVALAAGVGAGLWWHARQDAREPAWIATQLTTSGIAGAPRISPDGRTLAFISISGGQSRVAVMIPGSSNWTILTPDASKGAVNYLAWTHDGTKVIFQRRQNLYSVPALGGDERLVLENALVGEPLADGSILFVRANANRHMQLHRYWPESGKIDPLPVETGSPVRVFPDGKEVALIGQPLSGDNQKNDFDLRVLDLASGKLRSLAKNVITAAPIAIAPGGQSVLVLSRGGDLLRVVEVPRDGGSKVKPWFTLTDSVQTLDTGPDGAIYLDQVTRPFDVLAFSTTGGVPDRTASIRAGKLSLPLPDGRMLLSANIAGAETVLIAKPGKDPLPLVESETTRAPMALLGTQEVVLRAGKGPDTRMLAVVSLADGRVVRRIEATKGLSIVGLAGSSDGKTIFYSTGNDVFSIPSQGGEPHKIGAGVLFAANPNGQDIVVNRINGDTTTLVRIPLSGGAEQPIPYNSPLLLNSAFSPAAIRGDGKIAITVAAEDSWWDEPAILDPKTGKVERLTVPYQGDVYWTAWMANGRMMASGQQIQNVIWKFSKDR